MKRKRTTAGTSGDTSKSKENKSYQHLKTPSQVTRIKCWQLTCLENHLYGHNLCHVYHIDINVIYIMYTCL